MLHGRPPRCIHCGSKRSSRKGLRRTKGLGIRQIRKCKDCGRKFTPKNQKRVDEMPTESKEEQFNPINKLFSILKK